MASKGWICIHRQLQDCILWTNNQPFDVRSAWIDLLMLANHEDKNILFDFESIVVKRGQYLTSVRKLGERWSWSKNRVLKYLRLLEKLQMIQRESDSKRTLITIENYDKFQNARDTDEDTGKDTGKDTEGTQEGHGYATNNNDNNENNDNNKNNNRAFVKPTVEEVRAYCEERKNNIDAESFVDFYESKGWMIGKNKMKDWKSAVRTWERSRKQSNTGVETNKKIHNYDERDYDFDELMKMATGGNG